MPTEYGKILLQQIEQQKRQRLQQRAEERGLPIPSDEQLRNLSSTTALRASGWTAPASTPGSGGDAPLEAEEYSESKEILNQGTPSLGGASLNFSEVEPSQQRLKDAKKKYQAELLQQMRERAAEREAEKARRKREDEEERIRLIREIEQERLAKEEEDALQLVRSKQLAEANAATVGPPKQGQPRQGPGASLDNDVGSRPTLTGFKRNARDQEEPGQPFSENTIYVPQEIEFRRDSENGGREHEIPCERFPQQMPATGVEVERCLLMRFEALQAEVKSQTEEMRHLKDQQRRVLQHIHQGTVFRNACCERQCYSANASDSCVWHPATHPRHTAMNTKTTPEQHVLQAQYAFVTTVLKNAGISDPEDMMRRLAESGAISMNCDTACPGVVPLNKASCPYSSAPPDRQGQLVEKLSLCEGQGCGVPHVSSTKLSTARGLSNSSCYSNHEAKPDVLPQQAKDECQSSKNEGTQAEDPEDRPLPALLKRQQEPIQRNREPDPHLRDSAAHQQQEPLQEQTIKTVNPSEVSGEKESDTAAGNGIQTKWEDKHEPPGKPVGRTKLSTSADTPADRKWRFNELWACLSHGFPPPPALGPITRAPDRDRDDPISVSSSWCTTECEPELPCQTIFVPHTSDFTTPSASKRLQQGVARQGENFPKDGWLPSSQMETLEESTAQTYMPEVHGHLSRQAQELYETFVSRVEGGIAHEGVSVAKDTPKLMAGRREEASRFKESNTHQERQPLVPRAEAGFTGSKNMICDDQLWPGHDQQICRALSVDAAPLKLQQLRKWDFQIRQKYTADVPLKERCLHHLQTVANQAEPQGSPTQNTCLPRVQERFKSRLSWEADTALPTDEGSPAQSHVTKAQVSTFGPRPFVPLLQAPLSPTARQEQNRAAQANVESTSPTPAKPPSKHVLPLDKSTRSSSVNAFNKKSRFTRAFWGAMLPRSNSRTRQ
ncbi:hypothetical protein, conserved [Eimeria praecox]|uniref:CCDC66 domain-containing protein n=1 Tax=Eimeria praecox TaxID=51316 RepID=U6G986_9EIME|nr:hypothetical protein, conserved [Eimeria praecox]